MKFEPKLTEAVLLKRNKSFLAEVVVGDEVHRTVYCPHTGGILDTIWAGSRIWLSHTDNPRRKYPYTWELVEIKPNHLICVNPMHSPILIQEALEESRIEILKNYQTMTLDPVIAGQRLDFLLCEDEQHADCYVSVQSVLLGDEIQRGFYPDIKSHRSEKELEALINAHRQGYRAVLVYCVLNNQIAKIFPADHIDHDYGKLLRQAIIEGVEVIAYNIDISIEGLTVNEPVPVVIPARMLCQERAEKSQ